MLLFILCYLESDVGVDVNQAVEKNKHWSMSGDGKAKGASNMIGDMNDSDDEKAGAAIKVEGPSELMQTLISRIRYLKNTCLISTNSRTST